MHTRVNPHGPALLLLGLAGLLPAASVFAQNSQLDESCTVSALNRSAQVQPDGTWVLPNVPANVGEVRVRATCVEGGETRFGQSGFVAVLVNGVIQVPEIIIDAPAPVPATLSLSAATTLLTAAGETVQLTATATLPDGTATDVSAPGLGTGYASSNWAIATVDVNGLVTA